MLDLDTLLDRLQSTRLADDTIPLVETARAACAGFRHGDLPRWQAAVQSLPGIPGVSARLDQRCVEIATTEPLTGALQAQVRSALLSLRPWRKGPFTVCGITIDSEWRSDLKWQRVSPHLSPLAGRRVLDVGCGSGYHVWRMAGAGAEVVIGVDPGLLFNMQFSALQHFVQHPTTAVLPLKLEQLPPLGCFDTVFSMGVLYHRREPSQHLKELKAAMAPGAELVLETLVIPPGDTPVLVPQLRYARMRNVWHIPTSETLCDWLAASGFSDIRLVSEADTSTDEQRSTDWMPFESLAQSLHPELPALTVEGYPAPRRAVVIARH